MKPAVADVPLTCEQFSGAQLPRPLMPVEFLNEKALQFCIFVSSYHRDLEWNRLEHYSTTIRHFVYRSLVAIDLELVKTLGRENNSQICDLLQLIKISVNQLVNH